MQVVKNYVSINYMLFSIINKLIWVHSLLIENKCSIYSIHYLYCYSIQNKFNNMFFSAVLKIICIMKHLSYFRNIIKCKEY